MEKTPVYNDNQVSKQKKAIVMLAFILLFLLMIYLNKSMRQDEQLVGWYGVLMMSYLATKMVLSFFYKPYTNSAPLLKVSVVIPSFNEHGEVLVETLKSVLNQTYPIEEIFIIDDGSDDQTELWMLNDFLLSNPRSTRKVIFKRLHVNGGKRNAQSWAFQRAKGDVFFTVDSDGYVYPDALEELMKPFVDEDVYAVTGHINARNRNHNLLTKLLDIRYENAFRVERAAQSVTGNILVCSGPISCYRKEVVLPNLQHYTQQKFLGKIVHAGDDRCLTNYAIRLGRTVYQSGARCDTDVPDNLRQFLKQQIRWNKSFFRESIEGLKIINKRPIVGIWILLELSLWIVLSAMILYSMVRNVYSLNLMILLYAVFSVIVSALTRNIYYIVKHPFLFLLSPLYGFIHIILLFPIRIYSLLTLKDVKWGTRSEKEAKI